MSGKILSPKELIAAKNAKTQPPPSTPHSPSPPSPSSSVISTTPVDQKLNIVNEIVGVTPNTTENITKMSDHSIPNDSPLASDLSLTLECVRKVISE
jgi:hypothetical protein